MTESQAQPNSDVIITKRGGGDAVRVSMSGLVISWEVSRAGQLSGFVPVADLNAVGLGADNLMGRWIAHEHPTAGRWTGVITFANYVDGVCEIGGQTFHILTHRRIVSISGTGDAPYVGTPASVFRMAFQRIRNSGPLFLELGTVEDGGRQVEVTFHAADFYDEVIPQITEDIGREWNVSADRVVTYGKRIGVDRASSVRLIEGRAILASSGIADDLFAAVNSIRASGYGTTSQVTGKGKKAQTITANFAIGPLVVTNPSSVDKYGPLEVARDYGYVGTAVALRKYAEQELKGIDSPKSKDDTVLDVEPESTATILLADEDNAFSSFAEGDTVTVEIGLSGILAEIRVINRSLDVARGVMTISGIGRRV